MRTPAPSLLVLLGVALIPIAVTGCGDAAPPSTVTVTHTVTEATTDEARTEETGSDAVTRSSRGGESPQIVKPVTLFSSPSKNIGCAIDRDYARCDIGQKSWEAPAAPVSCDLDYGDALQVSKGGEGAFVCHGDTTRGSPKVLEYGDSVQATPAGVVICSSAAEGMTCENQDTGHGFFIARESYRIF
jgi:hypothetical protein